MKSRRSSLQPVGRKSLSDAVFEQIRDRIVSGVIEPGEVLPAERQLCEILNVNRGALREALKRLEQARLVSIRHGGQTTVSDFRQTAGVELLGSLMVKPDGSVNISVARSIIEMRDLIAPEVARLAALRITPESVGELRALVPQFRQHRQELDRLQDLSMEYWRTLVASCGNLAYQLLHNNLYNVYGVLREILQGVLAEELTNIDLVESLTEAVARHDSIQARSLAEQWVGCGTRNLLGMLSSIDDAGAAT